MAYDAERRRLVQHATTATTAPPPAAAPIVEDPELAQLAEDAAAVNGESRLLLSMLKAASSLTLPLTVLVVVFLVTFRPEASCLACLGCEFAMQDCT